MNEILLSTIRLSTPVLFAALGGMLSERSGIANIALEAQLLFSAFAAAAATSLSGSVTVGILVAIVVGAIVAAVFGSICIWGRGDQIVVGTGMNLLAVGAIPVINRSLFLVTGSTPALSLDQRITNPYIMFVFALFLVFLLRLFFVNTKLGVRVLAAGHNPTALSTQGVSFKKVRLQSVIMGGVICSFGGIYLSICQASSYSRNMSAGRGFLALAALIFGVWRPIPTLLACLFFGLTDAVQIKLQGIEISGTPVPNQFVQIVPYIVTLVVLAVYSANIRAPSAINQDVDARVS